MPGLLRAFGKRVAGFRAVPGVPVTIDRFNPYARGLACAYLPGVSMGYNIAQPGFADMTTIGTSPNQTGGTPTFLTTREGPSFHCINEPDGLSCLAPTSLKSYTKLTLYWRGYIVNHTGNFTSFGLHFGNPEQTPFTIAEIGIVGGTPSANWNAAGVQKGLNGTAQTFPGFFSIANTYNVGGNVNLYVNGRSNATAVAFGAAQTTIASAPLLMETATNMGNRTINTDTNLCCLWLRELSAAEIAGFEANPYQIFAPLIRDQTQINPFFFDSPGSMIVRPRSRRWGHNG